MVNSQVKFETTSADQNIFKLVEIKTFISDLQNLDSESYDARFIDSKYNGEIKGFLMYFDIIFDSANRVGVNDRPYNDLISDKVYSSGVADTIYDISVETIGTGILVFNIKA